MAVYWGILTAILILLALPVRVLLSAATGVSPRVILRYLFFSLTLYPQPEKEKQEKPKPEEKPKEPKKKKKPKEKRDFGPLLSQLWAYWERLAAPIKRLLRRTSLAKVQLHLVVVGEDAAATALRFGKINAAVYSAVAMLDQVFTLRVKQIEIIPGFTAEREEYSFSGEVRVIPLAALIAALQLGFWALVALIRSTGVRQKEVKQNRRDDTAEGKDAYHGKQTSNQ